MRDHGTQVCGGAGGAGPHHHGAHRSLIRTERTTVTTKDGRKRNGRLLYHILPIQLAIDQYYERQMDMADLALEQQKAKQRLAALERKECASGC